VMLPMPPAPFFGLYYAGIFSWVWVRMGIGWMDVGGHFRLSFSVPLSLSLAKTFCTIILPFCIPREQKKSHVPLRDTLRRSVM
jgi:hypothetical protein